MQNKDKNTTNKPSTLDFSHVSREILGIVTRRRELMVFLGSLFVALSIYLDNLLHGGLPPALANMAEHTFFHYSLMLLVPSILIALRIMRLHSGLTINGVFFSQLLRRYGDATADPVIASHLNWSGISTGLFFLAGLNAALASVLFALALKVGGWAALAVGIGCASILLILFALNHRRARRFAIGYIKTALLEMPHKEEVDDHYAHSLQDANQDMIGITAFVGLILFSVMENLSGLGGISNYAGDIAAADIMKFGPVIYATFALMTAIMGTIMYRRLVVAAGNLSLKIDPNDKPFVPFRITDSFLGYLMLCALFAIALHLTTFGLLADTLLLWRIELALNILMVALYPLRMWQENR